MASMDKAVKAIIIDTMMTNSAKEGEGLFLDEIKRISLYACVMGLSIMNPVRLDGRTGLLERYGNSSS
jgi:hypothetical protein